MEDQIQKWIERELKDIKWKKSTGYTIRENARKLLQKAFHGVDEKKSTMCLWAIEQTVYDRW